MQPQSISIEGKEPAYVSILQERKKLLEDVFDSHDGGIIVKGTCEETVLDFLLQKGLQQQQAYLLFSLCSLHN